MAVQLNRNASLRFGFASPSQNFSLKPSVHISQSAKPIPSLPSFPCSSSNPGQNSARIFGVELRASASSSSTEPIVSNDLQTFDSPSRNKKKLGVVVKPLEKPRLVLKFIWMQKDIGIALDQMIPGYGTIPLSPYYFWPRKDAWEELKVLLESKPWISELQRIHLLNQATDLINLWQANGGGLS